MKLDTAQVSSENCLQFFGDVECNQKISKALSVISLGKYLKFDKQTYHS